MAPLTINSVIRMDSGFDIPALGYGVYQTPEKECEDVVLQSFKAGYRHVDSAISYKNEAACGSAILKSGIPRKDIFFTSKIPTRTLKTHIKELEEERGEGKGGVISVGQWELHPWLQRPDIVGWCQKRGVILEAYSPLVRGERLEDKLIQPLAKKYGKTAAQVLVRWSLQRGFVPLPKSVTPSRILENADVFDFELTAEDMKSLETDEYSPCCWDPTKATLQD
ncbi:putative oxidoreductase [Lachnellula hyalina]|uniref:Putative oxidoreductase n=1 Tax=Lachnellula hyalina TaxID=1316788 RepID=A0A8H8R972_9HELO|nr:putative oxidoreductase [Lachnellula hyalina]TVY30950.1 putative oxidoreductase [Lachnellula hyalina]